MAKPKFKKNVAIQLPKNGAVGTSTKVIFPFGGNMTSNGDLAETLKVTIVVIYCDENNKRRTDTWTTNVVNRTDTLVYGKKSNGNYLCLTLTLDSSTLGNSCPAPLKPTPPTAGDVTITVTNDPNGTGEDSQMESEGIDVIFFP